MGEKIRASMGSRVQQGGGRRAVALRYAGNVGYTVPKKKVVKKRKKRKKTRTKVVYVYK